VNSAADSGGALKTIGWVLVILGLIFLLIISILLGALLMLLGLVFIVAAPSAD
jgi:membrane-bound ClpP family serine protease